MPVQLADLGWRVHLIAEEYPDDAQEIPDEQRLDYGLGRGWVPLCKDGRIKGRAHEREPFIRHAGVLFYLDNQQLRVTAMVERIHGAQTLIHRAVATGGPAAYAIGADGIRRTWP